MLEILDDADISKLTTLRVVARAEKLAYPNNIEELKELFKYIKENNFTWNVLGAGSNTLVSSRPLKGVLISTNNLDFMQKFDDSIIEVGAGMRMPRFCALMTKESLSGTEFMEGIPGSIGGGIVMNAGAHGSEISKILLGVKLFNLQNFEVELWSNGNTQESLEKLTGLKAIGDLALGYRSSSIDPQKHLILSGIFQLKSEDKTKIRELVLHNNQARTSSQPIKSYTCGCTFQNPEGYGAGKLIDELGLKGSKEGDFMVSNMHGNFFENLGSGTSYDFCKLMSRVQKVAQEKKGLKLKPEVKPMGEFSEEEKRIWDY